MNTNVSDVIENRKKNPRLLTDRDIAIMPYTQISNLLIDEWLPIIGGANWAVLTCILRKTTGWHKLEDQISRSQLVAMTGMSKSTVKICLDELVEFGLIIRKECHKKNGTYDANLVILNIVSFDSISIFNPNDRNSTDGSLPPDLVDRNSTDGRPKLDHTKETPTKEREIEKEEINACATLPPKKSPKTSASKVQRDLSLSIKEANELRAKWGQEFFIRALQKLEEWKIEMRKSNPKAVERYTDYGRLKNWVQRQLRKEDAEEEMIKRMEGKETKKFAPRIIEPEVENLSYERRNRKTPEQQQKLREEAEHYRRTGQFLS